MDILLAGPGTGKTTKVKSLIKDNYCDEDNILVLSFTNATVNDLRSSFKKFKNVNCSTLHSYALRINHLPKLHVLDDLNEINIIKYYAEKLDISISEMCGFLGCITFDDMIYKCVEFLDNNSAYAEEKIGNIDLLIVDEYQDFNQNERELVAIVASFSEKTLILGDDDQSIYEFKDADPDGIIDLYKSKSINKLTHHNICYRCPDVIVDKCTNLISKNKNRLQKEWKKSGKDGEILYKQCLTQENTFTLITNTIKKLKKDDAKGTFLILCPVRFYIDELVDNLESNGLAVLNFWADPITKEDLVKIWWLETIFLENKLLFLLFICKEVGLWSKPKFKALFLNSFKSSFNKKKLAKDIIDLGYLPSELTEFIFSKKTFEEFLSVNQEFIPFKDFLDDEDIKTSVEEIKRNYKPVILFDKKSINLMSIHKSKGLQADYVFIYGLNEGILPNVIKGIDTIEAQRRLLFVGMTRALKKLFILSTVEWDGKYINKVDKNQFTYHFHHKKYLGKASRFISEFKK